MTTTSGQPCTNKHSNTNDCFARTRYLVERQTVPETHGTRYHRMSTPRLNLAGDPPQHFVGSCGSNEGLQNNVSQADEDTTSSDEHTEEQLVTARLLAPQSDGLELKNGTSETVVGVAAKEGINEASINIGDSAETCMQDEYALTATKTHPLSSVISMQTESPASRAPNSLSRRRGGSASLNHHHHHHHQRRGNTLVPSLATASSSSTTTASTSSSSLRQRSIGVANRSADVIDEESSNNQGGLRASLDSGMAAVRRWIRHRSSNSAVTSSTSSSRPLVPASPASRTRRANEDMSQALFEDDDLIQFDEVRQGGGSSINGSNYNVDDFDSFQQMLLHQSQPSSHHAFNRINPPTIVEERNNGLGPEPYRSVRQRALSEPDALRIRDFLFQRALSAPQRGFRRRRFPIVSTRQQRRTRERTRSESIELTATGRGAALSISTSPSSTSQLSSSAAEVLYASARSLRQSGERAGSGLDLSNDADAAEISTIEHSTHEDGMVTVRSSGNTLTVSGQTDLDADPNRDSRARWIRINRRFQLVITIVALIFSLLLFAILVCWVVLTSAYVVSIDKSCDVPLKAYFWLVTLQLILDVFRTDIMRLFFRWDANSNQHIPCRVITYNIAYLTYALLVLRVGIHSVYMDKGITCRRTAPELFQSSTAFVSLSIAAWSTIVLGYLVPFCCVATLLTWNGYSPSAETHPSGGGPAAPFATVFPSSLGAPPGCVDQLRIVMLEEFPDDFPMECCICMEDFVGSEVIVMTECNHVFHKQCCREWLRQARTCPVCRMDIPTALEGNMDDPEHNSTPSRQQQHQRRGGTSQIGAFGSAGRPFVRNDFHHEVVNLLRILRRREGQLRRTRRNESSEVSTRSGGSVARDTSSSVGNRDQGLPTSSARDDGSHLGALEDGQEIRSYQAS